MAQTNCSSQNCLIHREVMGKIQDIKKELEQIQLRIKEKVDKDELGELNRQVENMKTKIDKLTESDIRHSEILTGIHGVLDEFKEIHKDMREDYGKLLKSQIETQSNLSEITGMIKAEKEDNAPWYISFIKNNNWVQISLFIVVLLFSFIVITKWSDVMDILTKMLS